MIMITATEARAVTANGSTGVESPVLTAFLAVFAEEAVFFDVVGVGFLLFWSEGVTFSVSFVSYSDSVSGVVSDFGNLFHACHSSLQRSGSTTWHPF